MAINKDIHTIDLMLGIPEQEDRSDWYKFMEPLLRDEESRSMFKMPAQYMFKDIPETGSHDDFIQFTIEQMDKFNINQAMIGFHEKSEVKIEAAKNHADRFFFDLPVNANIEDEAQNIKRHYETYGIKAVSAFPSGMYPQVAINDPKWHPIYEMCVELDIPFFCCVGVPGPRIPMAPQKVELTPYDLTKGRITYRLRNTDKNQLSFCHQCKVPSDYHKNCNNDACHLLFIQCDKCNDKFKGCCSKDCMDFASLDLDTQKKLRKDENKKVSSAKLSTKFRPKLYKLFNYWK